MDHESVVRVRRSHSPGGVVAVLVGIGSGFGVLGLLSGEATGAAIIGGITLLLCGTVLLSTPPFRGTGGGACGCACARGSKRPGEA